MSAVIAVLLSLVTPPGGIGETVLVDPNVAVATTGATRTGNTVQETPTMPPPPTAPPVPVFDSTHNGSACIGAIPLLEYLSPGWSSQTMAKLAYRESRCNPGARNTSSSATGLLQVLASHCPWLARELDTWCTRDRLTDPVFNILAAAAIWEEQGYQAWSTY